MISLTPHEVEQLLSLRLSLEEALSRAKSATKYRRATAIVALDATVERASSIVAVTRGLSVPTNGKLEDLISRLVQDFGAAWKPGVLPDIRHLRRARNASQHEGLEPDREQVPHWASAVNVYVSSLIETHFGIDIRQVLLSDAIRDADLRILIRKGEEARRRGDHRGCVDYAKEAYEDALTRWNRLRGSQGYPPGRAEVLDRKGFDFLEGRLDNMRAFLDAAAFSPDSAEAAWFTSAIEERGDVLDAEDAERVLMFAFEWIVEYERASDSWTPNRRHRAAVARRLVRAREGRARIEECVSVDLEDGHLRAIFRIADVPQQEGYSSWARTLRDLLPETDGNQWWSVLDDGTVELDKANGQIADLTTDVAALDYALRQAETTIRSTLEAAAEEVRVTEQTRAEYAETLKSILSDLPDWAESIEWSKDGLDESPEQMLLSLTDEVDSLKFGERRQNSFFDSRQSIADMIRSHALVQQCYWTTGSNELGIQPVLNAEQLKSVFSQTDLAVREQLDVEKRSKDQREERLMKAHADIASKLAEIKSRDANS